MSAPAEPQSTTATFGNGCFWCTEAVFQRINGVSSVVPGYIGGDVANPTYRQVCSGTTGHAEAVQIEFDPSVESYAQLLAVFFRTHDPTTLNRQGPDVGTQYRSHIFYHDDAQKQAAEAIIQELNAAKVFADPIVTQVSPAPEFHAAEDYHHDYFDRNRNDPYCRAMINPKLDKLLAEFPERLKEGVR